MRPEAQRRKTTTRRGPMPPKRPWFGEQLDLFPRRVHVESLDPRVHIGPRTGVAALYKILFPDDQRPHLVFKDRYGTYCEEHGKGCPAVQALR